MPDALGVQDQGVTQEGTSLDYLGVRSPTAFRGQPALPSGAGPAPGGAAPPTTAIGRAFQGPLQPQTSGPVGETTFADLASQLGGNEAGSAGGSAGDFGGGPAAGIGGPGLGSSVASLGVGPEGGFGSVGGHTFGTPSSPSANISLGPLGNLSATISPTGNTAIDTVSNSVLGQALNQGGFKTGLNLIGLVAPSLVGALGLANAVISLPAVINGFLNAFGVQTNDTQIATLSQGLVDPDPQIAEQALGQLNSLADEIAANTSSFAFSAPGTSIGPGAGYGGSTSLGSGFSIDSSGTISNALGQPTGHSMTLGDLAQSIFGGPQAPTISPDVEAGTGQGATAPSGEGQGQGGGMAAEGASGPGGPY